MNHLVMYQERTSYNVQNTAAMSAGKMLRINLKSKAGLEGLLSKRCGTRTEVDIYLKWPGGDDVAPEAQMLGGRVDSGL